MSDFIKSFDLLVEPAMADYHSLKEFASASSLKLLKKSPAHYFEAERKETDAMIFGSAYHCYILEPDKFEKEYYVLNDKPIYDVLIGEGSKSPRSTKIYKEWVESEMVLATGKIMLDLNDFETIKAMKERLTRHKYAVSLINHGVPELAVFANIHTEQGEVKVKMRADYVKWNKRIIIDLKTCADASADGFKRQAADLDYHIQAALYSDMLSMQTNELPWTFIFIAQEKVKPYAFNIFECSNKFIAQGRYEYELLLMLWKYCNENNFWPGYQVWCDNKYGILSLDLPTWANKEINYYIHEEKPIKTNLFI